MLTVRDHDEGGGIGRASKEESMSEQAGEGHAPARVYLQPIGAFTILGLYAFAGSTLIVAAELAGW